MQSCWNSVKTDVCSAWVLLDVKHVIGLTLFLSFFLEYELECQNYREPLQWTPMYTFVIL